MGEKGWGGGIRGGGGGHARELSRVQSWVGGGDFMGVGRKSKG